MDSTSVRDISRTFPSVPFLFPKPGFWREDEPFMTVALNQNRNLTYTSSDYEELLKTLELPDTLEIYKDVSALIPHLKPPNGNYHFDLYIMLVCYTMYYSLRILELSN